jgi:hypothetical protein
MNITPLPSLDSLDELPVRGYALGARGRVLLGAWGLLLLSGFALAASLDPDPRGFGTHQRLGLPPCSFQILFGVNCPSCGSTTCFAHFVRGQWMSAMQSNSAAFILALVCAAMVPWSWYSVWSGRLWQIESPATTLMWLLIGLCGLSLGQWIVRMLLE